MMMVREMVVRCLIGVVGLLMVMMRPCHGFGSSGGGDAKIRRCIEEERQALLHFKQHLIDPFAVLSSWESPDCCQWKGVQCSNRTGHVIVLDLSFAYIEGRATSSLGNLSQLQHLDLRHNFYLKVEKLDWLSHLSSLTYLGLDNVNLSKAMDWAEAVTMLPSLTELYLRQCGLHLLSPTSLPSINSSVRSLAVLDLSFNALTPSIFTWLLNFTSTSLAILDLSVNELQGVIPSEPFRHLNSLAYLDLSFNQLQGVIPKSFANLTSLRTLGLSSNNFRQYLPNFLQNLFEGAENSLEILRLDGNHLTRSLPNFTPLSSLTDLYLSDNQLNGSLDFFPWSFAHLSNLTVIDLSRNQLTGSVPDLSVFSSLEIVDVSYNQLNGTVDQGLGKLAQVVSLNLSSNFLQGNISEAHLSQLSNLKFLNLSFNSLALNLSSNWTPPFSLQGIALASCRLGPGFPSWLQKQRHCSELDISGAGISDTIPDWFWDFSPVIRSINISYNRISGQMPDLSVKDTTPYAYIDLRHNLFEGPIPHFPPLGSLFLSNNMFSGSISFICALSSDSLNLVDLSSNQLSGEVPDCWIHHSVLVILNLADNNLSGKIPDSVGFLYQLEYLNLRNNNFIGELPFSLTNCRELKIIDAGENKFSGKIPDWIGTHLPSLTVFSLRVNRFHGSIPPTVCHLSHIQVLDFSQNNISGNIPHCLNNFTPLVRKTSSKETISFSHSFDSGNFRHEDQYLANARLQWKGRVLEYKNTLGLLRVIDLSSNQLVGKIPEEISDLAQLVSLNLSRNDLTGSIILNISDLKLLETLDLSRNQLSGEIPTGFASLNFLAVLDLSNNNLSGKIPSSTQLQSFNASTYTGNPQLCGLPLPNKCPGFAATTVPGESKNVGEENGSFINREFYISMGLGFGVGFGGVFSTLLLKPRWCSACFKLLKNLYDWVYVTTVVNVARLRRRLQS